MSRPVSPEQYEPSWQEPDDQPEWPDGECGFCGGVGTVDEGDWLCPTGCWRVTA